MSFASLFTPTRKLLRPCGQRFGTSAACLSFLVLGLLPNPVPGQSLTNDLVVHLTFDGVLTDDSGRQNHASAMGAPTFLTGLIGSGALQFSSAANSSAFNYVTLGVRPDLQFGVTNDFAISCWVRLNSWTGDPAFLSNKDWVSGANPGWALATDVDGRVQWNYRESSPNTRKDYDGPAGTFVARGGWRHLVVSLQRGGGARTYVDGSLVDSRTLTMGTNTPTTIDSGLPLNIGQDGTGSYTNVGEVSSNGVIDDVGIWRRTLSAAEVNQIYLAGLGGTNLSAIGEIPAAPGTNLIGHWVFAASNITGSVVHDLTGNRNATIVGNKSLYVSNAVEAIYLDGGTYAQVATNLAGLTLPTRAISEAAWVTLFSGTTWGGILGVVQDNGTFERGWVLGYNNSQFTFAVSSTGADDGDGVITYLPATTNYTLSRWHHVVGTYDGWNQLIYINGQLAGASTIQSGDLNYSPATPFSLGVYHDDNEFFPLHGLVKEVKLYSTALSPTEIAAQFQQSSNLLGQFPVAPLGPGCTNAVARTNSPFGQRRVLVIGIDGARVDSLLAANTPNLDQLVANGASSYSAQCSLGQPTVSGPNWSSILTGVWANKHSVSNNSFTAPKYGTYPHLFARIRQAQPQAYLSSIVNWSPINTIILTNESFKLSGLSDSRVAAAAACHLREAGPDMLFLHFDNMDATGHASGFHPGNPNYLAAFNQLDSQIGTVLQAVRQRKIELGEQWLVCVVSDHGGTAGGSHGGQSPEELNVPFLLHGPAVIPGNLPAPIENVDLVPTIFTYLGVSINPAWGLDGNAVGLRSKLNLQIQGPTLILDWPGQGALQESTNLLGTWTEVANATSPHTNSSSAGLKFFRLRY